MILFIGEHPKGHDKPFHPSTRSGKRLRDMVSDVGIEAEYENLWPSQESQDNGWESSWTLSKAIGYINSGIKCVALGRRVQKALKKLDVICLPHPGARRKIDIETLRNGIERLANERL